MLNEILEIGNKLRLQKYKTKERMTIDSFAFLFNMTENICTNFMGSFIWNVYLTTYLLNMRVTFHNPVLFPPRKLILPIQFLSMARLEVHWRAIRKTLTLEGSSCVGYYYPDAERGPLLRYVYLSISLFILF